MSHLLLTTEAVEAMVDNIVAFQELDPTDDEEFGECDQRLLALKYMLTDILRQVGEDPSTPTEMEELGRSRNPFYVAILTSDGRIP